MKRKKKSLTLIVILTVFIIGGVGFVLISDKKDSDSDVKSAATTEAIVSDRVGMTVQKDISLRQGSMSEDERVKGGLWKLAQPTDSQQQFVIDANYERGDSLKKLTGYTGKSLRDSVVQNINLQLPRQFPGYKELTQRNLAVNGIDANETVFEYDSSGVRIRQRLLLLFKNSDTAIYIRAQAKASDFDAVNSKYFEPLFQSAKFE